MNCQRCSSDRVAHVKGKTADMCMYDYKDLGRDDYVPRDVGIGGGDFVEFSYCLECGQMQGNWPITEEVVVGVFPQPSCYRCGETYERLTSCEWCGNLVCDDCTIKIERRVPNTEDTIWVTYCHVKCEKEDTEANYKNR